MQRHRDQAHEGGVSPEQARRQHPARFCARLLIGFAPCNVKACGCVKSIGTAATVYARVRLCAQHWRAEPAMLRKRTGARVTLSRGQDLA